MLEGASVVIDVTNAPSREVRATQFFEFVKSIADLSTIDDKVYLPPALFQPIAADDVASAVSRVAVAAPVNATIEVGGPEQFHLDELVRQALAKAGDSREVVTDPHARYYGVDLSERTLVPGDHAQLGHTRFVEWLNQSTAPSPAKPPAVVAEAP